MTPGRIPRLRAPALTITILFAVVALSLALLGSLALADDNSTIPTEVPAEETAATEPAPTSATASTSLRAHQPGDAVDGSKATHWAAISRNYPQWLVVDLGAPQRVAKSSISWLRAKKVRKYFYRLEGSLDGEDWQLLADRSKKSAYNYTNDTLDVEVQYLRVTVLGANRGRAGIKEIKVKKDTTEGDEWAVVTPTPEPSPEPTNPGDEWAVVTPTPTPTAPVATGDAVISSLSASHTAVGAQLTITGTGFGSTRGTSRVW
ncbi:MAG: discoidin domain-containing protein, partial [Thermoleophilia bacterium]|nr:discoidin domain-containing protein [Thermoleophilia bacterium]